MQAGQALMVMFVKMGNVTQISSMQTSYQTESSIENVVLSSRSLFSIYSGDISAFVFLCYTS